MVRDIHATAIVGGANNQLADDAVADTLLAAGICYVPDFVANAGGLINIWHEGSGYQPSLVRQRVDAIAATVREVLELAEQCDETPLATAMSLVSQRLSTGTA